MSPVREIEPPGALAFRKEIVPAGEPVVMRGLVADWPWVGLERAGLLSAIRQASLGKPVMTFAAPPETDGYYTYTPDLSGVNFERVQQPLGELLDELDTGAPGHRYAGGVNISEHLPGFLDSHPAPLLEEATERLTSLWVGGRGRIPAHWDLPDNIAAVVHGQRRFTLFPPDQIGNLYVGPIDRTLAGQPSSLVDVNDPDFARFPRAREAMSKARTVTLFPGDAIFIPSLWFHAVENPGQPGDDLGVLVNIWWRDAPAHAFTPQLTLMHALLSLRDLPAPERARWRGLFDHYVFGADEDTLAHLPKGQRGVLGSLEAGEAEQLRAYLGRHLLRQ